MNTGVNIRDKIVEKRRSRIRAEGFSLGVEMPKTRETPVIPFGRTPHVICEIKRKSPSRGEISSNLDPVDQARRYIDRGITSISILTEEDHFSGSLEDIMRVKKAFPGVSVLRKDFLFAPEDIDVSYLAGADAVLLIASILDQAIIAELYKRAKSYGMMALVEVHDRHDISNVRGLRPELTGINSRDLNTFHVDFLHPVKLRSGIDWKTSLVFESGIMGEEEAAFAAGAGFDCLLVGEAVVKNPDLISGIITGISKHSSSGFWFRLLSRAGKDGPFVKICGLTNKPDVAMATELGADILGFIFAKSPRKVDGTFLRSLGVSQMGDPPRVAVVVADSNGLDDEVHELLAEGYIDAVQFHGRELPEECYPMAFPYYKALRIADTDGVEMMKRYSCPRVLLDAYVPGLQGGTGKQLSSAIVRAAGSIQPVWLAGGITPDNVQEIIRNYCPELIDLSTGVELNPGKKDPDKMKLFFGRITHEGVS